MLCRVALSWTDARDTCEALGGQLAVIGDADENLLLAELGDVWIGAAFWIGLSDRDEEDSWIWVDGAPLDYAAWSSGEPNDYGGGEDCVQSNYGGAGVWNDLTCGEVEPFICEAL